MEDKVSPRETPDRDSRYMGLAWIHAAFSKDPSTQVGSIIISKDNVPLGSGYNGPPAKVNDSEVNWNRPPKEDPDAFSKYDIIVHAELNAIDHSNNISLENSTIYVTAMPCPNCMREIVRKNISRVVYMDFKSSKNSSLQNQKWRAKSIEIARLGKVKLEEFKGNINWIVDWTTRLKELGAFEIEK